MSSATPADHLKNRLFSLLSGNFVAPNDLQEKGRKVDGYRIRVQANWGFGTSVAVNSHAGNPGMDHCRHFGRDEADYHQHIQQIKDMAAADHDTRSRFLNGLREQGVASMELLSSTRSILREYEPISHYYGCSDCKETGKVRCNSCRGSGQEQCPRCYGARGRYEQRPFMTSDGRGNTVTNYESVWVSCMHCMFSGWVNCSDCSGDGKLRCSSCKGHGFFTRIAEVSMVAEATPELSYEAGLGHEELLQTLKAISWKDYAKVLDSTAVELTEEGAGGVIRYDFRATVSEISLAIRNTVFTVRAVGRFAENLLHPPMIFDWLFKDALEKWKAIQPGKRRRAIRPAEAKRLFDTLCSAKVSTAMLERLAEGDHKLEPLANSLRWDACQGLMSPGCATNIVTAVRQCLDMLSPRYSEAAWSWAMLVPWLVAYMLSHFSFELGITLKRDGQLLFILAVVSLGLLGVGALVAHPASRWLCRRQQKCVPSNFRRKPAWREPLQHSLRVMGVVMAVGFLSGKLFFFWGISPMEDLLEKMVSLLIGA